ncbi:TIM barrel protein [Candidatus Dojkabacteria bacterium]|uniref:TIM barrel protein n=1 Tax=Candidatus Dojkabacteria bacterium TaxID=2099670 RepID=A0A955KZB1_9BACT|nr:TIM barrel protein [Candidatus Dojkabacteria bacterium]
MTKLNIGVGGVPLTSEKNNSISGIERVKELNLDLMEIEFVHGVKMTEESAKKVNEARKSAEIELTIHGPYYINLASDDNRKFYGSIKYITDSIYIGGLCGARSVTFHPAFYQKKEKGEVYSQVKSAFEKIFKEFEKDKFKDHPVNLREICIAPELTGKPTQFGDIEELVKLADELKEFNLKLCIDFAHKYARSNGEFNGYEKFDEILSLVEKYLGKEFLNQLHMHVSAINYGDKGEKNHLTFLQSVEEYNSEGIMIEGLDSEFKKLEEKGKTFDSGFKWRELLQVLKDKKVGGFLVCESPILEYDALLLKQTYDNL